MGAWGPGTFDNDTPCDWGYELETCEDLSLVRETLRKAAESGDEFLDSDEGWEALAACEVVARLKGNWGERNAYSESIDAWVEAHPQAVPEDVVKLSLAAIDRVLAPESELPELWADSDSEREWRDAVEDLRWRVQGV